MSLWMFPTLVIAVLLTIPPLGAFLRIWGPSAGFFPFFIGIFFALVTGIALAGAAAFASVTGLPWRGAALRGAIFPLLVVAVVYVIRPDSVAINDISTDLEDRTSFTLDVAAAPGLSRLQSERSAYLAELQREHYPRVRPIVVDDPPAVSFERCLAVARSLPRWTVTLQEPATGRIEAVAESRIFGFVDDVAIRIRLEGAGSRIDIRSRSRLGQSDMGANARRILAFGEALSLLSR